MNVDIQSSQPVHWITLPNFYFCKMHIMIFSGSVLSSDYFCGVINIILYFFYFKLPKFQNNFKMVIHALNAYSALANVVNKIRVSKGKIECALQYIF